MLGRRSLIEYVRTSHHRGNARTSITYRVCKDVTGHRGNARTSITYRVCKDHRSQR